MADKKLSAVTITSVIGNIGLVVALLTSGKQVGKLPVINPANIDTCVINYTPIRLSKMPVATNDKIAIVAMRNDSVWAMIRFKSQENFDMLLKGIPCKR